jgi:PAS domain S-box-containing protein
MTPELITPAAEQQALEGLLKHEPGRRSADHYKHLIELLPAALYTTNGEGFVTFFNNAAKELWGRAPVIDKDQWCGSWKIYNTDGGELPLDECPMAIALRERRPVFGHEIVIERPDGTRRNIMPHPQPFFDEAGNLAGAINMLIDITALKISERTLRDLATTLEKRIEDRTVDLRHKIEELRKSEERYHKMIDEVEDYAILLMDKSGVIQNWNRGAQKIKGYTEEEIVGQNFRVFYLPEDRERGLPDLLIEQAKKNGKALHEGWRLRKDGSVFWGSIVITALHDTDNNIVGFSKVTRDLTERKLAEDKIRQYANELEFQNKELEQFAYAAAHDMKEPLRKIMFYTNLVFDNSGHMLPVKESEYLKRSISAAGRMQVLIDDLLTYSKASTLEQEYKKVDLGKVMVEIQLTHYDTIKEIKATIETTNLPVVDGISFQLMQLFDNLLGNALKYRHPDRAPHIVISAEKVMAQEPGADSTSVEKEYHRITVSDNGIGFDAQYAEKVFDLFQRLHDKISYSGTGIGLALCRKIIQNHKGFITARSEEGNGASFMVYFPVHRS